MNDTMVDPSPQTGKSCDHASTDRCHACEPLLIKLDKAAAQLGISTRRLQSLVASNAVPSRRIGRCLRFEPLELRAWVACGCPVEPDVAVRVRKAVSQ